MIKYSVVPVPAKKELFLYLNLISNNLFSDGCIIVAGKQQNVLMHNPSN
jgi:hypothetical protein